MINIYDKTETVFNHSGLATLEPIECVFAPMINDVWKLEMTLPYDDDGKYKLVENDKFIRVTNLDAISEQSGTQLFRIYDHKKQDNSLYVLAYPVGLDARFDTFADSLDLINKTASEAIAIINNMSAKYTVSTNMTNTASGEYENVNMIEALNGEDGFVHHWGGEICYDNYNIKVNNKLGNQSSNADVRYGKNIQSMTVEEDISNVVTRIYPKSSRGDILNGISAYARGQHPYIDSSHINDYPIVHNYYTEVPHTLVTQNDDGSAEYYETVSIYNNIAQYVRDIVAAKTDAILKNTSGDLPNMNLEWLIWFSGLTMDNDGTEGFAERVARLASANCVDDDYKELIRKAVIQGFKSGFETIADTSYDWVVYNGGLAYCPNNNTAWRWKRAWVKKDNTWRYIGNNGVWYDDPEHIDTGTWDWYKNTKKSKYKRYGDKSLKKQTELWFYLKEEMYKVKDVWYYFSDVGKGIHGKALLTTLGFATLYDDIITTTYSSTTLQAKIEAGEASLFNILYMQMEDYCAALYADGIDLPALTMEIDLVDLSITTEYKDFQNLLKVRLGDKVKCVNYKLDRISTERVIGLEYDVLRGYNRKVYIGETENSTINMLNISNTSETKLVAGEGIEIKNNVINVVPQPSGVKDVIINGESVVVGGVASFDIDAPVIEGTGLEYFVESEHTISGDDSYQRGQIEHDSDYLSKNILAEYEYLRYDVTLSATPSSKVIYGTFEGVDITSMSTGGASTPGFMMLSKKQSNLSAAWHYIDTAGGEDNHGVRGYNNETDVHHLLSYELYYQTGTAVVEGETWYGIFFYLLHGGMDSECVTGDIRSTIKFIGNLQNPTVYATCSAFMSALMSKKETVEVYNGIARHNKLAFFAGGSDDEGTNAPIKIYADGTTEGLSTIRDVTVDGESVVHDDVAEIDLSGKQDVLTAGTNIDIQNDTISTSFGDFAGSDHGLVPAASVSDSGKVLKSDGTWFAGAVLLTMADYNALSTAQKNNGSIYFVYSEADPDYDYLSVKNGEIIARKHKTTGEVTWWFVGYSNGGNDWQFPSEYQSWLPQDSLIYGVSYDSDTTTINAQVGFYVGYVREWTYDLGNFWPYPTWGVITNSGGQGQTNLWSSPPDSNLENAIYYMSHKFSSVEGG